MEDLVKVSKCEVIELGRMPDETIQGLVQVFVTSKLTRCSQEQFEVSLENAISKGLDKNVAYEQALHAAVLNEVILEAIVEQLLEEEV